MVWNFTKVSVKLFNCNFYQYRINGFKVSHHPETWSWICAKRECPTSKPFELKSTVQFIEVPVQWHYQNTSKFWILQDLDECEGDICWNQLMYPFTHAKMGDQIAFVTMWGLTLLPLTIFLLWFLRYFWWIQDICLLL